MPLTTGQTAVFNVQVQFGLDNQQFLKGLSAMGSRMEAVGKRMTMTLTAPIVAIGALSLKMAGDFQYAMNQVAAVSGATGEQFEALSEQAKELGRTTQFSASQAASAMSFLAMAGFEVNEIVGAMPATLNLAAAAQMDLAEAADIVSNILTGYRLPVEELSHATDVLTTVMTSANTNLLQLGDAMTYAAPIASAAGIGFEEAAAAIGLMGNAGIQASMAGTSLRGAISRLLNPMDEAVEVMDRLGLVAVDASGELLPLESIIGQLEGSGLSAADALTIFGQRAGPAMAALVAQGRDALIELTEKGIEAAGITTDIAEKQMEGFTGAMKRLASAFEGLMIAISESGLLDAVTKFAEGIAKWFTELAKLDPELLNLIVVIAGIVAALGPLLVIFGQILMVAPALGMAVSVMFGPWGPVILGVVAVVGLLTAAIVKSRIASAKLQEAIDENIIGMEKYKDDVVALTDELNELEGETDDNNEAFETFKDRIVAIRDEHPSFLEKMGLSIDAQGTLYDRLGNTIDGLGELQTEFNSFDVSAFVGETNRAIESLSKLATLQAVMAQPTFFEFITGTRVSPVTGQYLPISEELPRLIQEEEQAAGLAKWLDQMSVFWDTVEATAEAGAAALSTIVDGDDEGDQRRRSAEETETAITDALESVEAEAQEFAFLFPSTMEVALRETIETITSLIRESGQAPQEFVFTFPTLTPEEQFEQSPMGQGIIAIIEGLKTFGQNTEAVAKKIPGIWDKLDEAMIDGTRMLGRSIISGDIARALAKTFDMLANIIAQHIETRIMAQIPGLGGGLLGALGGGLVGGAISLLGGLFGGGKSIGTDVSTPLFAYITNWDEFYQFGTTLPESFIYSGRQGRYDVDPHGRTLDSMRTEWEGGEHFDY